MPIRKTSLVNGKYYHVFNKTIDQKKSFVSRQDYQRAVTALLFYSFKQNNHDLSKFMRLTSKSQIEFINNHHSSTVSSVIAFCLMPNHFHILLKQIIKGGISYHLKEFQNSYTRFLNIKQKRSGPLFLTQFKAVKIETENQFLHVSRYIHLNPFSSNIVKSKQKLLSYPWSSLPHYLSKKTTLLQSVIDKSDTMSYFQNNPEKYKKFILDHSDHQKSLKQIQNLLLE